ncbi:MAG: hypothetical protein ABSC21_15395 [Terriglobia bacterium]|jgi:hypothetical protein
MALTIPPRYVAGMSAIISLPDDSIEELNAALSKIAPSINVREIESETAANLKSISQQNAVKIVRAIVSLYAARFYSGDTPAPIDEFVEDLWQALVQSGRKELQVPPEDKERIKARFKRLLSLETFSLGSKAIGLQYEHEHSFCTARILTDARPLYGQDVKSPPKAAVIIHNLKVSYHQESSEALKEFYVAMDASDIKKLKEVLDRAQSKAASLRSLLDSIGVVVLE